MAGPGVALRLYEVKERQGSRQHDENLMCRVSRKGRDVVGLYPGQLGRAHMIHSPLHRPKLLSVKSPSGPEQQYQRSFDFLTLQALEQSPYTPLTHGTVYQQEFSRQAHLCPPDDTKITLRSHPAPLDKNEEQLLPDQPLHSLY